MAEITHEHLDELERLLAEGVSEYDGEPAMSMRLLQAAGRALPDLIVAARRSMEAARERDEGRREIVSAANCDWTVSDSIRAGVVLTRLGYDTHASIEPGADHRRDVLAADFSACRDAERRRAKAAESYLSVLEKENQGLRDGLNEILDGMIDSRDEIDVEDWIEVASETLKTGRGDVIGDDDGLADTGHADALGTAYAAGRRAGLTEAAEIAKAATEKWGRPIGTQYEEGAYDHGHRIHAAIRAFIVSSPAQPMPNECKWCGGIGHVTDSGAFGCAGSTTRCWGCDGTGRADSSVS